MICPYCKNEAEWVPNEVVYGKRYGKSWMCWWCQPCNAYVGCHNNTKEPLGTMANKGLRALRMKAHAHIDPLWKTGRISRARMYEALKEMFGREIHIGSSDAELCTEILKIDVTKIK